MLLKLTYNKNIYRIYIEYVIYLVDWITDEYTYFLSFFGSDFEIPLDPLLVDGGGGGGVKVAVAKLSGVAVAKLSGVAGVTKLALSEINKNKISSLTLYWQQYTTITLHQQQ